MATWLAALLLVAAVALFVAAPLTGGLLRRRPASTDEVALERLEHERALAVQGLRELEFDHAMGKVDETDFVTLHAKLQARALNAMSSLEQARREDRGAPLRLASSRARATPPSASQAASVARASRIRFCPQCGSATGSGYNFCAECGTSLASGMRAAGQGD